MKSLNLKKLKNSKNKIWINIASSTYVLEDYINLEYHLFFKYLWFFKRIKFLLSKGHRDYIEAFIQAKKSTKMYVHDCRKKINLPKDSVDHILCSHFLEHIHQDELKINLKNYYKILKTNGTLHIIVPDIKVLIEQYIKNSNDKKSKNKAADIFIERTILTRKSKGSLRFRILDFLGYGLNHKWMYDYFSMENQVINAGFKIVHKNEIPSSNYRKEDKEIYTSIHIFAKK